MYKQNQLLAASVIILLATLTLIEGASLHQKVRMQNLSKNVTTTTTAMHTVASTPVTYPIEKDDAGKEYYIMRTVSGPDGYTLTQYCADKPLQLTNPDSTPFYKDAPICLWGPVLELKDRRGVDISRFDVYGTPGLHDWYLINGFSFIERNGNRYILITNEINNFDEILEAGDNRSVGVNVVGIGGGTLRVSEGYYGYEHPIDPAIAAKGYSVYENASCSGGPGCSGTVTVVDHVTGDSAETKEVFDFQNHEGLVLKSVKFDEKSGNFTLTATQGSTTKDIVLTLKPKPSKQ
ncbi:MAG: hypothetical protein U0487_03130 [Patescibacteria group bacterium]